MNRMKDYEFSLDCPACGMWTFFYEKGQTEFQCCECDRWWPLRATQEGAIWTAPECNEEIKEILR